MNMISTLMNMKNQGSVQINAAQNWQYGFQTPYSPMSEGIIRFHDDLMVFLTFMLFFVLYIMGTCISHFKMENDKIKEGYTKEFMHHPILEMIWTVMPALILIVIAMPSFSLLYSVDELVEPLMTFKVVGHQWYWSYELMSPSELTEAFFGEQNGKEIMGETSFDSYLLPEDELYSENALTHKSLLTVDNHLIMPTEVNTRVTVTSADVLHSWAIPSLGVKLDACPGRLNQTSLYMEHPGIYYGQCSEICGANHGFMPMGIVSPELMKNSDMSVLFDLDPFLVMLNNSTK